MMGRLLLAALCIWSCALTVTPLNEEEVGRATNYIQQNIFRNSDVQYAFFVKFNVEECNASLEIEVLEEALQEERPEEAREIMKKKEIYNGKRLVAAKFKGKTHSESRLLDPPGSKSAPIIRLLENAPPAGCVIFFSLNSPCLKKCTNPTHTDNIINKLNRVPNLPDYENRAFAFRKLYRSDEGKPEAVFSEYWGALNGKMELMRCDGNNCIRCFESDPTQQNLNPGCYTKLLLSTGQ